MIGVDGKFIAEDMPKLQSPFKRDRVKINGSNHYVVTDQIDNDFLWVFEDPEAYPQEKLDGTNVSVVIKDGRLTEVWNRKNLVSKLVNIDSNRDEIWENTEGFDHIIEGIKQSIDLGYINKLSDGQYFGELIGFGIQDNPMDLPYKIWIPFSTLGEDILVYKDWQSIKKDFNSISEYMRKLKSNYYYTVHGKDEYAEGIILYRPSTGEKAKLRRDMFDWWIKDNPGVINKHVNTYHKKSNQKQPEGMAKEFSILTARKKQGLITIEQFNQERNKILEQYGLLGNNKTQLKEI